MLTDIPRMFSVVEVTVYLFGFHDNEIRAQLVSEAAGPAGFSSSGAELAGFLPQGAPLSSSASPFCSQPLMLAKDLLENLPRHGDLGQDGARLIHMLWFV